MKKKSTRLLLVAGILFLAVAVFVASVVTIQKINGTVSRKITLEEAQQIVLDVIKQYEGVVTVKEKDLQKNTYVVDYNKHTALAYIGVSNDKWAKGKYAQAAFSCQLKPLNNGNDTLITMRKHSYHGGIFSISTFNHYKKIYNELKFNGKRVVKYKKYLAESKS